MASSGIRIESFFILLMSTVRNIPGLIKFSLLFISATKKMFLVLASTLELMVLILPLKILDGNIALLISTFWPTFIVDKNPSGTAKIALITEVSSNVVIWVEGCIKLPILTALSPKVPENGALMYVSSNFDWVTSNWASATLTSESFSSNSDSVIALFFIRLSNLLY